MITLGYDIAEWIADVLPSPADPGQPFVLSDGQVGFTALWYSVDERGQFLYRRSLLQEAKGFGKSPLGAALAIAEFVGPVLFDGFDASGRPVGRPWGTNGSPAAWVQVAGSSEEAANANIFHLVWSLLSENTAGAAEKLGIDQGRTRLYLKSQPAAKLEAVTSEAGSREGQRVTFALLEESHLWVRSSGGLRLARTLRRNAGKMNGRTLELANAYETGTGSVAELTADAYEAGEPGILYVHNAPSTEPTPDMSDDELLPLLTEVYGGNLPWIDTNRILQEVRDPATGWDEAKRYYFNVASSGLDAFVDAAQWAALGVETEPVPGSRVTLGFLGASVDSAALILCSEDDRLCPIEIWEGAVPRDEVEQAIAWCFEKYHVVLLYADARGWRSELETWATTYRDDVVLAFPSNSPRRMEPLVDRFRVAVAEGQLGHDGDEVLTAHINNARLRSTRGGGHVIEAAPGREITGALAAVMAFEANAHYQFRWSRSWRGGPDMALKRKFKDENDATPTTDSDGPLIWWGPPLFRRADPTWIRLPGGLTAPVSDPSARDFVKDPEEEEEE